MRIIKQVIGILLITSSIIRAQSNCENDTIAPTIECLPFTSLTIPASESQLFAVDFILEISDNCVDEFNYSFLPDFSVDRYSYGPYINCNDLSEINITDEPLLSQDSISIYVSDNNGNISSCKTEITDVRILGANCNINYDVEFKVFDVNGNITTERTPILKIHLIDNFRDIIDSTFYANPLMVGERYVYSPTNFSGIAIEEPFEHVSVNLEYEPLTSEYITVSDLLLIQNHILGINQFTEEWQLIAADVNSDDKISIQDLIILRNVILGSPNTIEIASHKIIPDKNITLSNLGFINTRFHSLSKNLEYTLIRNGDLNDQLN